MTAKLVVVAYEVEGLEPLILTVEESVRRSSFIDVPPSLDPKELKLGQNTISTWRHKLPLLYQMEINSIMVYSSSNVIAKCLGVPEHNVRVITRRVGGGFGGKAIRAMPVSTSCALAAHKLHRPVRMYLNHNTDSRILGGRHPLRTTYSVGFKSDGKITALQLEILVDAGISENISPIIPANLLGSLKKYDWRALSFDIMVCKTNHSSKSAMRGPGEVQGSFIAEAIIEHIASFLLMEVDSLRYRNLHMYNSLRLLYEDAAGEASKYTLPLIWDRLAISSSFNQRNQKVKEFNTSNRWQ